MALARACAIIAVALVLLPGVRAGQQLRGLRSTSNSSGEPALEGDEVQVIDNLEVGWNTSNVTEEAVVEDLVNTSGLMVLAESSHHSSCESHPSSSRCYLYRACTHGSYCAMGGYMIVPGFACAGMESINGGNAGSYDYLMSAAKGRCGDTHCVLITNPVGHRTQDQLHIHYRHYNGGGSALKSKLEHSLCGKHGWQYFSECGAGKAKIYSGFPGVFSEVASAYGGGSLANVGITVWFTTACGGLQTIILATTGCSIEHSVSSR